MLQHAAVAEEAPNLKTLHLVDRHGAAQRPRRCARKVYAEIHAVQQEREGGGEGRERYQGPKV